MNKALDNLLERRSIRSYKPGQISDDELKSVLKAGLAAPSAMNRQPTVLLVVQDKATIQLLSKLNALVMGKEGIDPFYGAPTVIVVLSDRNIPHARRGRQSRSRKSHERGKCSRSRLMLDKQGKGSV